MFFIGDVFLAFSFLIELWSNLSESIRIVESTGLFEIPSTTKTAYFSSTLSCNQQTPPHRLRPTPISIQKKLGATYLQCTAYWQFRVIWCEYLKLVRYFEDPSMKSYIQVVGYPLFAGYQNKTNIYALPC